MSPTKIAISPEEVDILIEALRSWGPAPLWNWRAVDKAFATEAYALRDRLVTERRSARRSWSDGASRAPHPER